MAEFAQALDALRRDGECWHAIVPQSWANGRTVYGGLLAAYTLRTMRECLVERLGTAAGCESALPLRSLQITFVAPVPAGEPLELRPQLLRSGRSATHVRCDLLLQDTVACATVAVFGADRPSRVRLDIARQDPPAGVDDLPDMPRVPGVTPEFAKHLQLRWADGGIPYSGRNEPRSVIYARMQDPHCSAEELLLALADSIPTPALAMLDRPAPAASMNWMIEPIGDPAKLDRTRWSLIGTEVRAGSDGYLSQTSVLWGPEGHAYAVSHQSVAIFG